MAILKIKDANGNVIDIPAITGPAGKDGYTPIKGVDYFTEEELSTLGVDIVQETGYSETAVMSQKSLTDIFEDTFEVHKSTNYFNGEYNGIEETNGLNITYSGGVALGYSINDNGEVIEEAGSYISYPFKVEAGTILYFKAMSIQNLMGIGIFAFYDKNMNFIHIEKTNNVKTTVPVGATYLRTGSIPNNKTWFTKTHKSVSTNSSAGSPYEAYYKPYYITLDADLRTEYVLQPEETEAITALSQNYLVNYVETLKKELKELREYVRENNPPTVLDSGSCGENLIWTLYDDGLLKISGTGRAYDYCKGTMIGKTRAEIEAYVANNSVTNEIVKHYGFQEGKTYDDANAQYVAPWYKYRPEPDIGPNGYSSEEAYNKHNPNGWTYNRIEIEPGITYLGDWMFYRVCGATELTVPEGVETIGRWCIRFCTSLITINLPNSLKTIEEYGISRHENALKAIKFGNSLETIGNCAFTTLKELEVIELPHSIKTVGTNLFEMCRSLKYADLGALTAIPNNLFSNCSSLEKVIIPNTVVSVGDYAFYNCASLKTLHLPESITNYKNQYLPNLTDLYIDSAAVASGTMFGLNEGYKPKYIHIREDITNINSSTTSTYTKGATFNGYTRYTLK